MPRWSILHTELFSLYDLHCKHVDSSQLEAEQPEHAAEQKQYEESTRSIVALQQKGKNIKADNNKMKAACAELKPKTVCRKYLPRWDYFILLTVTYCRLLFVYLNRQDEVEMDIQRLQQDMETLRSQIVESPERLENVTCKFIMILITLLIERQHTSSLLPLWL